MPISIRNKRNNSVLIVVFLMVYSMSTTFASSGVTLKIGTLAPDGSVWIKEFRELTKEVVDATQGSVRFKIYPGGVLGDDQVMLRKIRVGQLDGGCFTSQALCTIYPDFRALALPGMFRNKAEVDYLLEKYGPTLEAEFRRKGYESLGITGIGFTYMFTRRRLGDEFDFKKLKPWLWQNDPIMKAIYKAGDITPISVGIGDVMTALQTGLLDTVFNTPTGILAMQWFTRVKQMTDYPLTYSFGAFLVRDRSWKKVPEKYRTVVRDIVTRHMDRITQKMHENDLHAKEVIAQKGVAIIRPSETLQKQIQTIFAKARAEIISTCLDVDAVKRIETILSEFRTKQ